MFAEAIYDDLRTKLRGIVPDFELQYKAELAHEINQLKREKNAVILGHNYKQSQYGEARHTDVMGTAARSRTRRLVPCLAFLSEAVAIPKTRPVLVFEQPIERGAQALLGSFPPLQPHDT